MAQPAGHRCHRISQPWTTARNRNCALPVRKLTRTSVQLPARHLHSATPHLTCMRPIRRACAACVAAIRQLRACHPPTLECHAMQCAMPHALRARCALCCVHASPAYAACPRLTCPLHARSLRARRPLTARVPDASGQLARTLLLPCGMAREDKATHHL